MKNVIQPLADSVFVPLELTAKASVADAGIQNNVKLRNTINIK